MRYSIFLAFPLLAAATVSAATLESRQALPVGCTLLCCNTTVPYSDPTLNVLAGLLGVTLAGNGLAGLTCSPISVISASNNGCNAQLVCCADNSHNGLVAFGCIPVGVVGS